LAHENPRLREQAQPIVDIRLIGNHGGEHHGDRLMTNTTAPDRNFRTLFIAAFMLALALQGWAAYLRLTQQPAPTWTHGVQTVLVEIVFGFYFLIIPPRGMTPKTRRTFIALFFGVSALTLMTIYY
jgi:peptidoglycan/LPS O-acetylase OafA/YrhL